MINKTSIEEKTPNKKMIAPYQLADFYGVSLATFLNWLRNILTLNPSLEKSINFYRKTFPNDGQYIERWRVVRKGLMPSEVMTLIKVLGKPPSTPIKVLGEPTLTPKTRITLTTIAKKYKTSKRSLLAAIKEYLPDNFFFKNIQVSERCTLLKSKTDGKKAQKPRNERKFRRRTRGNSKKSTRKPHELLKLTCLTPNQALIIEKIYMGD